jgi:cytochrome c-type protein NapC
MSWGAALAGAVAIATLLTPPASALDWSGVAGKEIVLFYAGQASFEWVLTPSDHSGAKKLKEGKTCLECHGGEEADIGARIASGAKLEPNPIPGKAGSITATVQTANDGDRLYVRISWSEPPAPSGAKMDPDEQAKVTLMIEDGTLVEAKRAGCWGMCHDDLIGMASAQAGKDLTKYLGLSRAKLTRQGGGENYKSSADLDAALKEGKFMELWQAVLNQGAVVKAVDGYVLDQRHMNASPLVEAQAEFAGGTWTVVLSRKLVVGQAGHKDIVAGKTYNVGFAIHDAYAAHRFHHVSLGLTLALDQGSTDLVAVKK